MKGCMLPLNTSRAAARKMEYYARKSTTKPIAVHHVLADLCQQLYCDAKDDCEEEAETSDQRIFEINLQLEDSSSEEDDPHRYHDDFPVVIINHVQFTGKSCDIPSSDTPKGSASILQPRNRIWELRKHAHTATCLMFPSSPPQRGGEKFSVSGRTNTVS